jgi:activator of HSP90 ATPase
MKPARATKQIVQNVVFDAEPQRVFDALMVSRKHSAFTGSAASIQPRIGGSFSCYDGYITGFTIELEPSKRIVQVWRSRGWPKGTYSIVTFELKRKGPRKTELRLSQCGVPASDYAEKEKGWRTHYWEPLGAFLRSQEPTKNLRSRSRKTK